MDLQATWTPESTLFFWTMQGNLERVIDREWPELAGVTGKRTRRVLVRPGDEGLTRAATAGYEVHLTASLHALVRCTGAGLSDSMRLWTWATRFALELAVAQRVVPTVEGGKARWRVLLGRTQDGDRFEHLVQACPPTARAVATSTRGAIQLHGASRLIRSFLDAIVETLYRTDTHAGPDRGWPLAFAESLRVGGAPFRPREAHHFSVPEQLRTWATGNRRSPLWLGMRLGLPAGDAPCFPVDFTLHPAGRPGANVPLSTAWTAGPQLTIDGVDYERPAAAAIRGLARVVRLVPQLASALNGPNPTSVVLDAHQTWDLLGRGAAALRDAGFQLDVPPGFDPDGDHRIRVRLRVPSEASFGPDALVPCTWEVALGDRVVDGDRFADLIRQGEPLVRFEGDWIVLDPLELEKLPKTLSDHRHLQGTQVLRGLLTGRLEGEAVVADEGLLARLLTLQNPPLVEPPAGLNGTLRPYQQQGLSWLAALGELGLGALLADDMGLGKTVQLIAHLLRRRERDARSPASLVVCPTSLLGNWRRELAKFAPGLRVARYHGTDRVFDQDADVVLTTYGLLTRDPALFERRWDLAVLDEAQAIKNASSARAVTAGRLQARQRVCITGTPVENRLDELWSLMAFINPGLLGTLAHFRRAIAVPIERFGAEDATRQLKAVVSPFMLRRLKSDPTIRDDLPEKLETADYCALTQEQAQLYNQVIEDTLRILPDNTPIARRGRVLAMLTRLKQVCNHPAHLLDEPDGALVGRSGKLERLTRLLDTILASGERTIIFTQYVAMGRLLQRHLFETYETEVPFLHGGLTAPQRDAMVDDFQRDGGPAIWLVSLRAGGTGLNLTAANHVIHYDRWWNPAVEDQATDRIHRFGQARQVHVHKLVCQGSLDERLDAMLAAKRDLANRVVGDGESWITELDDQALRELVALGEDAVELH